MAREEERLRRTGTEERTGADLDVGEDRYAWWLGEERGREGARSQREGEREGESQRGSEGE